MVTLLCAVVGVGSIFPVNIDISETVGDLKNKIKEKKPGLIYFDADLLKLYLAREGDTSRDEDMKALNAKRFPDRIKNLMQEHLRLDEAWYLNHDGYFDVDFTPKEGDIHVLVECPDEPHQFIKYEQQDGFVDSFVENWFSWHSPWSSLQSLFTVEKEKLA